MSRVILLLPLLAACVAKSECPAGTTSVDGECVSDAEAGCVAVEGATVTVSPGTDTLGAALAVAVAGDVVGLEDGDYVESDELVVPAGVRVVGACPERVTVHRTVDDPGFRVEDADGVGLSGFTLEGGAPGVEVTASAAIGVSLDHLTLRSSGSYGVFVAGPVTLEASALDVSDTLVAGDGTLGRGLSAQSGATLSLTGGTFTRTAEVAVFADSATLTLDDVAIADTQPSAAGLYGRGLHLQHGAALVGRGLTLSGNREHGICVLDSAADVADSTVSGTLLAPLADGTGDAGDAVAVFLGDEGSAATGSVRLSGLTLSGNARAGLIADAYPVEIDGLVFTGNTYSWVTQNGATLAGADTSTVDGAETALEGLSGAEALSIYDEPME